MPQLTKLPIAESDWQQTSPAVQRVVLGLWSEVNQLRTQLRQLRAEVARLQEQVGHTSHQSSRAPSSDPPEVEKPKDPSSRPPRGQGEFFSCPHCRGRGKCNCEGCTAGIERNFYNSSQVICVPCEGTGKVWVEQK